MTRTTYLGAILAAAALFSVAAPAYAASLTPAQDSAVIGLLQSFGVDQQTLTNVEISLGMLPASGAFSATPSSGAAPLAVSFRDSNLASGTYFIDYGDGQNSGPINTIEPPCSVANSSACGPTIANSHTYTTLGTYTATLSQYIACLHATPTCMIAQPAPIGSAVITVTNGPAPSCSSIGFDLGEGARGDAVSELQQSLGVRSTGYFGPLTKAAVAAWQSAHGIAATGFFGRLTRAAMGDSICSPVRLYSLSPTTGSVGTTVAITGFGFTASNTVLMGGNVAAQGVPISSTRAITCTTDPNCHGGIQQTLLFTVPPSLTPNCPSGSLCPMFIQAIAPGPFSVSVQNASGTSNAATFTVTASTP